MTQLLTARTLVLLACGISLATMLIRPVFPITGAQIGQLKLFQWPQFAAMSGLGIVAAQRGWLAPVPARIRRGCGFAALAGVVAFFALFALVAAAGDDEVVYETGVHWGPLVLAAIEGRPGPFVRAMSRSAYAAFLLQASS